MEKVLGIKEDYVCYSDFSVIDRVLEWLEQEDGELETMVGFGLCLVTVTYFAAQLVLSLLRW
jgi:hypothetical protein